MRRRWERKTEGENILFMRARREDRKEMEGGRERGEEGYCDRKLRGRKVG